MYSPFQLAIKYLQYYVTTHNGKGHGIHSPFVYDLVTLVLNDKSEYYCYQPIEAQRLQLNKDNRLLKIADMGAGSRKGTHYERRVGDIAKNALKPPKFSQLLFRLANYLQANTLVELGTSLGITTAYLASANPQAQVFSFEGIADIVQVARQNHELLGVQNITIFQGNFDETLESQLPAIGTVDFAYIDGNHREEPTLRYFEAMYPYLHAGSLLVFDDIHWSREMERAWETIKEDPRVKLTIDLFFIGLVFFNEDIKVKQDFVIRF